MYGNRTQSKTISDYKTGIPILFSRLRGNISAVVSARGLFCTRFKVKDLSVSGTAFTETKKPRFSPLQSDSVLVRRQNFIREQKGLIFSLGSSSPWKRLNRDGPRDRPDVMADRNFASHSERGKRPSEELIW
jgi:hypothetical protein